MTTLPAALALITAGAAIAAIIGVTSAMLTERRHRYLTRTRHHNRQPPRWEQLQTLNEYHHRHHPLPQHRTPAEIETIRAAQTLRQIVSGMPMSLEILDRQLGMSAEDRNRLLAPFYVAGVLYTLSTAAGLIVAPTGGLSRDAIETRGAVV